MPELRERAARLLALALKARENNDIDLAEKLTALATEMLDEAQTRERSVQQQQEPQQDDPEKE